MKKIILSVLLILLFASHAHASLNYALLFDGIDDFVKVPDSNSLDLSSGMTIEAWIKSDLISDSGARVIVSKWHDPTGEQSYIFKDHNSTPNLRIELSKGGHNDLADLGGATSLLTGDWIHVAATYDLNTVNLFYNGALDSSAPPKAPGESIYNSSTDLLIGTVNPFAGFETFDGQIDEVRIWNYARTQQQLQDNRFLALNGAEDGLMAYWNFDEGTGQTVFDLTINGNHGPTWLNFRY
ncbi:MAG: hypothetical protein A3C36_06095 [Omnitrophica WOR_2 bacterium RIFCSPHIGHO2_02_FULL_52_10]|nr:MAG: hypothetical protein A3C36_06095 [Omnitrophica WOR_2 bacterium RIFCSPHIGHO2_02_FULL_52_10]